MKLTCTSIRRPNAGKDLVPGKMFAVFSATAAGKTAVEQFEVTDFRHIEQAPVGKSAAALAANLIAEKTRNAGHQTIVMRFGNSLFASIANPKQALSINRLMNQLMNAFARWT